MSAQPAILPHDLVSETDLALLQQWNRWLQGESRPKFFARLWSQELAWHLLGLVLATERNPNQVFYLTSAPADLSTDAWLYPIRLEYKGLVTTLQLETANAAMAVLDRAEEELAGCFERPMPTLMDIVDKSFGTVPLNRFSLEAFYNRVNGEGTFQPWLASVLSRRLELCLGGCVVRSEGPRL